MKHTDETRQLMREKALIRLKNDPDSVLGKGIKGWYKGVFFRSSYEYFFMKQLENEGLTLHADVQIESFRIPYLDVDGVTERTYVTDFFVPSRNVVYEVKSRYQSISNEMVHVKAHAASIFLEDRGIAYKIVTEDDINMPSSTRERKKILKQDPCVFLLPKFTVEDHLDAMFAQQGDFMRLLQRERNFPEFPVDIKSKSGQKLIKDISHDCMHELFEAVHLLKNSKNHRKTEVEEFDRESFLEELVDAQHFLIEICILSGISPREFFKAYMKKGTINSSRILGGY